MATVHESAADDHYDSLMKTVAGRVRLRMAEDWRRDPAHAYGLNILGDPWGGWNTGQLAALDALLCAQTDGVLKMQFIEVGAKPGRDADREGNRAKLANLPHGFKATIYDGLSHDGDGWLDIPVAADVVIRDQGSVIATAGDPRLRWDGAPLEIGYTCASRTWLHLVEHGIVARWPYGYDRIYVVTTVPRYAFQSRERPGSEACRSCGSAV
jgi:hypothetical protein